MVKWAVRWMIRRNLKALRQGDPGPVLAGYADDAVLVFPGTSSWGGEHRGKVAIEAFFRSYLEAGVVGHPHDIVVNGPPWRTTVCMLLVVHACDDGGDVVYENRAIVFARAVWGRIVYHEDFEDTHKSLAFDRYLSERAPIVS
jgi:ketosteroid isomerase-like protein